MVTSEAQEIKKQETLVRFSIVSYKTRLRVLLQETATIKVTLCARKRKFGRVRNFNLFDGNPWDAVQALLKVFTYLYSNSYLKRIDILMIQCFCLRACLLHS